MPKPKKQACKHDSVITFPSPQGQITGYKAYTAQQIYTAATASRNAIGTRDRNIINHFPAPLVLPDDDLAVHPKYPPQNISSCAQVRNEITVDRKVIYIAAVPKIASEVKFMGSWLKPSANADASAPFKPPPFDQIVAYLQAFYHGIAVQRFSSTLTFRTWSDDSPKSTQKNSSSNPIQYIGLESDGSMTRIRARKLDVEADASPFSAYRHQLNLNDLLDHAISILPSDAYALLFMVDHDMYEDDEDDFCCGRAYGGSRVAVVSSAQYNPCLDEIHGIIDGDDGLSHVWPASHCETFVQRMCQIDENYNQHGGQQKLKPPVELAGNKRKRSESQATTVNPNRSRELPERQKPLSSPSTIGLTASNPVLIHSSPVPQNDSKQAGGVPYLAPLEAALRAHKSLSLRSVAFRSSTYALRVARTASHELGHCLGMDHCVYLACAMQGTCSGAEDARQPPYLCYICESKLGHAVVRYQLSADRTDGGNTKQSHQVGWKGKHQIIDPEILESALQKWIIDRQRAMVQFCQGAGASKGKSGREAFEPFEAWSKAILRALEESYS